MMCGGHWRNLVYERLGWEEERRFADTSKVVLSGWGGGGGGTLLKYPGRSHHPLYNFKKLCYF